MAHNKFMEKKVLSMLREGKKINYINQITGVPKPTIHRWKKQKNVVIENVNTEETKKKEREETMNKTMIRQMYDNSREVEEKTRETEEKEIMFSVEEDTPHTYYSSTNYEKFSLIKINRPLDMRRVDKLVNEINSGNNRLRNYPINVNHAFEINDGQHRFVAAETAKVEIYYIIDEELTMENAANANMITKGWTVSDCLHSYAARGYPDYMMLQKFQAKHDWMPISVLTSLCTSSNFRFANFKRGHYKADRMKYADNVVNMVIDFEKYVPFYKTRAFIQTLMNLANNPDYDHRQMMRKMAYQSAKLKQQATVETYLQVFTEIYNHRQPPKDHVFLTEFYHRRSSKKD